MKRTPVLLLAASSVALLLAACGGAGGGGSATSPSSDATSAATSTPGGGGSEGGSAEGCFEGTWQMDLVFLGEQVATNLGATMSAGGVTVVDASGEGVHTTTFNPDGSVDVVADFTIHIVANIPDLGDMVIDQHHSGQSTSEWTLTSGDAATFTIDLVEIERIDYTVTNTITIAGQTVEQPTDIDALGVGSASFQAVCTADSLTITPLVAGSMPSRWVRV